MDGFNLDGLIAFPYEAKQEASYQPHRAQNEMDPEDWKPFKAVAPGTQEIRINEGDGIFRVMYVAKFEEAIYVLHSFQKKTQQTDKTILILPKRATKQL